MEARQRIPSPLKSRYRVRAETRGEALSTSFWFHNSLSPKPLRVRPDLEIGGGSGQVGWLGIFSRKRCVARNLLQGYDQFNCSLSRNHDPKLYLVS
jgi:hypothetical protein